MEIPQKIGVIIGVLQYFGDLIWRSKLETQFRVGQIFWRSKFKTQFRVGKFFWQLIGMKGFVAIKIYKSQGARFFQISNGFRMERYSHILEWCGRIFIKGNISNNNNVIFTNHTSRPSHAYTVIMPYLKLHTAHCTLHTLPIMLSAYHTQ